MIVDCDIEASGLINWLKADPYPENVWCIVAKDMGTHASHVFIPQDALENIPYSMECGMAHYYALSAFKEWSKQVTEWWGHNFLSYDRVVLNERLGTDIRPEQVHDTLIMSKMVHTTRKGGLSLGALGEMLGEPKAEWSDWSKFSWGQLKYCIQDVEVTGKVREWVTKKLRHYSPRSIRLEHDVRVLLDKQQQNGFYLDVTKAKKIYNLCKSEADEIEATIEELFHPRPLPDREFTPKSTKAGGIALNSVGGQSIEHCTAGASFTRIKWKDFSITSPMEKLLRLDKWWKPTVRTKSGKSWQLCEENLKTLPDDAPVALRKLARWAILTSRYKTIQTEGSEAGWLANIGPTGRVHGYVDGLGASTGRCGHQKPNTANVPGIYDRQGNVALYGREMRECWTVEDTDNYCIVGTDASGIQLRVLAHYINNPAYILAITEGRQEDETDIHNVNKKALGALCKERSVAKTFIYAFLLGAGVLKISQILNCSFKQAKQAIENFKASIKGLEALLFRKTAAAKRGYMEGLDGRRVPIPSDHKSLSVYLQNGEAVVMKLAMCLWNTWATKAKLDYKQCSFVHDEFNCEVHKRDAVKLGELQVKSIIRAGELLNLNIALDGESQIGQSWAEVH